MPVDLLKDSDLENKRKLALAITTMVDPNILRYTSTRGMIGLSNVNFSSDIHTSGGFRGWLGGL